MLCGGSNPGGKQAVIVDGISYLVRRKYVLSTGSEFGGQFEFLFRDLLSNTRKRLLADGKSLGEIEIFRTMSNTLMAITESRLFGDGVFVGEYHGNAHQVWFIGDGQRARKKACCELADLMVIVFSKNLKQVRVSYIQAKYERVVVHNPFHHSYQGNLEQWYLLRTRPEIDGVNSFAPPSNLLSAARLGSIGSFVFYFQTGNVSNPMSLLYCAADNLDANGQIRLTKDGKYSKNGRLSVQKVSHYRQVNDFRESQLVSGCAGFATDLYNMQIGTPIDCSIGTDFEVRAWLAGVVTSLIRKGPRDLPTSAFESLLGILDVPDPVGVAVDDGLAFGAKRLFIIESDISERNLSGKDCV